MSASGAAVYTQSISVFKFLLETKKSQKNEIRISMKIERKKNFRSLTYENQNKLMYIYAAI
jgi:hypothetical protein